MIYLLVFLCSLYFVSLYENNGCCFVKNKCSNVYILIGAFIALMAGLRFFVGADTANYVNDFKTIPTLDLLTKKSFDYSRYRPGYLLLTSLCKTICDNFVLLQMCVALFSNYIILKFVWKKCNSPLLALLIYFITNYLEFNFEIMREVMAVSFSLLYFSSLEKKRFFLAFVYFILANMMHASAIMIILFPFLFKIKFSRKLVWIVLVFSVAEISIYQIIPDISMYADLVFGYGEYGEKYLERVINTDYNLNYYIFHFTKFLILPLSALWVLKDKGKYTGFVLVWVLLGLLSIFSYAFYRFTNYFSPFMWILYSESIICICRRLKPLRFGVMISAVIILLFFYQRGLLSMNGNNFLYERYFPYEMVGFDNNYNTNQSKYLIRRGN